MRAATETRTQIDDRSECVNLLQMDRARVYSVYTERIYAGRNRRQK